MDHSFQALFTKRIHRNNKIRNSQSKTLDFEKLEERRYLAADGIAPSLNVLESEVMATNSSTMVTAISAEPANVSYERSAPVSSTNRMSMGLTPISDMGRGEFYKGRPGGLYGRTGNLPPDAHANAALRMANRIMPRDANGRFSENGKIVMLSIGMSNTQIEFDAFMDMTNSRAHNEDLVLVNGAMRGQDAAAWANTTKPWDNLDKELAAAGVTDEQVQVIWVLQGHKSPAQHGAFPNHAQALAADMKTILNLAKQRFPNVRIAYLSSRIYGGHSTTPNIPGRGEPLAYENAFAVRSLIRDQIKGDPQLNWNPRAGQVASPLLLWGPYMWADGVTPRSDGLTWVPKDFQPDGTHPSAQGAQKAAGLMIDFFSQDNTSQNWFVGSTLNKQAFAQLGKLNLVTYLSGDGLDQTDSNVFTDFIDHPGVDAVDRTVILSDAVDRFSDDSIFDRSLSEDTVADTIDHVFEDPSNIGHFDYTDSIERGLDASTE